MRRRDFFRAAAGGSLALRAAGQEQEVVFRASSNLVVVNVSVRDASGKPIQGLTRDQFTLLENGKPQTLSVFEFQELSLAPASSAVAAPAAAVSNDVPAAQRYRDKRLIVLLFDFSGMPVADQIRVQDAALEFVNKRLTESDVVSIMSYSSALRVDQEFTADRDLLVETIRKFRVGEGLMPGLDSALSAEAETEEATASVDQLEFDLFNTDRKLGALESAAKLLAPFPEKKAVVYFSSGSGGGGAENQAQLQATINTAVRSNVSFYPVDARGLIATPPGGSASAASPGGTGVYSGSAQRGQRDQQFQEQDTLHALAADTGGKALLDSNDLSLGIRQAQADLQSYYTLGYYSTDPNRDGRFRRIQVKVSGVQNAKLDYRSGYYGEKDWRAYSSSDKERQLQDALTLGDPFTDVPLALEVTWFRLNPTKFFVPLALKIPASVLPAEPKGAVEFDFIAFVKDAKGRTVATVRDAIKLKLPPATRAGAPPRKSILYDTGFTVGPGRYRVKFLVRENQAGQMGTFESTFDIPEQPTVSPLVLSAQREPLSAAVGAADRKSKLVQNHPFVQDGQKLIPAVTKVFRNKQPLLLYAETYDPQVDPGSQLPSVATSVSIFSGRTKVLEASPVQVTAVAPNRSGVVPLQLQVPLEKLKPGAYVCKLSVVDQIGRKFSWRRSPLVVVA